MKPRLLDLFCGAGGAACGYVRAGFEVHGVDHLPQPRYLLSGASSFTQLDAMTYLDGRRMDGFDAIHASPPCQAYSRCKRIGNARPGHQEMACRVRRELHRIGLPFVIENVEGSPLHFPLMLCGTMFGLRLLRHRLFESSHLLLAPGPCRHRGDEFGVYAGKVTKIGTQAASYLDARGRTHWRPQTATLDDGRAALGIGWMTRHEMSQAIPPAFTEYVGRQLREVIR